MNNELNINLDSLQGIEDDSGELLREKLKEMPLRAKLEMLNGLLVDTCIMNMSQGQMRMNDLGSIVTLLKNNKVVEEKRELSESDIIDGLIE